VTVHQVTSILKSIVLLVNHNVVVVLKLLTIVLAVLVSESTPQPVPVHLVLDQEMMDLVNNAQLNVKNVTNTDVLDVTQNITECLMITETVSV
jgi:hypothetical protein